MSILIEINSLNSKNIFIKHISPQNNIKISKSILKTSPGKIIDKKYIPLDNISERKNTTSSNRIPHFIIPKRMDFQSKKITSNIQIKSNKSLKPKNLEVIAKSKTKTIPEKKPENNLRNSIDFPSDNTQLKKSVKRQKIIISKNDNEIKLESSFFKFPMNSFSSSHRSPLINYNKNNFFSAIKAIKDNCNKVIDIFINNEMKVEKQRKKNYDNSNNVKINSKEEKLKKIKIENPGVINNKKGNKDIKLTQSSNKTGNENRNKKINNKQDKVMEIIKDKNNNYEINEKTKNINKDIILRQKFVINGKEKESNNRKKNDFPKKEKIQTQINSIKNQINNKSEKVINNFDVSKDKISDNKKENKIYDIILDKIEENIDIRKQTQKKINNKINNKKLQSIKVIKKDAGIKNDNNIKLEQISKKKYNIDGEKNINNTNIITITKKDTKPKDKENNINDINAKQKRINNIEKNVKEKETENKNLTKSIKEKKKNINSIENEKGPKDGIRKTKKKEPEYGNINLIKQIIKRYEESPLKELRKSRSGIFSQTDKNSPIYIFNKIIYSIENKNKLIYKKPNYPSDKSIDIRYYFKPNDFKYLGIIGKGEYGKIYLVQWVANNNQFYAMKYEKFKDFEEAQKNQNITEIIKIFTTKTKSEGVVKIYGDICIKKDNLYHYYTLMEKMERDVEQECIIRYKYKKFYTENNLIDILCQLILACSSLQKHSICHGDIKPQNILILNGIYKLCDFGEVKIIAPEGLIEQDIGGTELYMSPKLFFGMKRKEKSVIHNAYKSDVFSLALCMLLMATFNYDILVQIREVIDMEKIKNVVNQFLSKRYSDNLISFLLLMLEIDENKRPDFIQLENDLIKK